MYDWLYGKDAQSRDNSILGKPQLKKYNIDLLSGPECLTGDIKKDLYFLRSLLFTPDEFIGGNLQQVQELRLTLVEHYAVDDSPERRQQMLENYFQDRFISWETLRKLTHDPKVVVNPLIRKDRFDRILQERSKIATRSNPERDQGDYKKAFEKARKNMHVPSIQTYLEAMRQSGGSLTLLKPSQQKVVTQALP